MESREKAKGLIMAGLVEVDQVRVDKAGALTPPTATISLKQPLCPYVSRGGLKLEAALRRFAIDVTDKVLLDVGASAGGFTDCLLTRGARKVFAVDVGYGQLHWRLRQDRRVVVLERTNIRHLTPTHLEEEPDGAAVDVSFISLRLVMPSVAELLPKEAFVIALIKPQFEVGKGRVGKGGVVRDPVLHREVVEELGVFFRGLGWTVAGQMPSPLLGPKGNREFLVHLRR